MRLWRALAVDAGDVVPCPRAGEALVASVPRRSSTGPTGPRASAPPGADVAALRVPAPGESMPAPPVVSAPEGVGGAARPCRASPRPRRPGGRVDLQVCGDPLRPRRPGGSRFGDVTWARISPGGLARIERRWISSLRARIVRAEVDFVALTWHYASRARSALVPTRAGPGPRWSRPAPARPARRALNPHEKRDSPTRAGPGPGIGWKPVRGRRGSGPGPRPIPPRPGPRDRRVTREHVT